jgi:hydroxymethylpyrimidine pyrophosphatase-like HAD family hydrolase
MTRVAFDVDGTLITFGDTPRYDVILLFQMLKGLGCEMFIWSGGGEDYATHWASKLGLEAEIVKKGSFMPDIAVDDERAFKLGTVNLFVGNPEDK